MRSYKDLVVWQKSVDLCEIIYKVTSKFPKEEVYGLTAQMRRASISIPSNIAEGQFRSHRNELIQFLRIAFGSGAELATQLEMARRVHYITQEDYQQIDDRIQEVLKMLNKMISSLLTS